MNCPRCQQENPPQAKFCLECATALVGADPGTHLTLPEKTGDLRRSLKEALDQQAATSEILRVISTLPMDVQPVFDVIVDSACRLCDGVYANVFRLDGDLMHFMAQHGFNAKGLEFMRRNFPARLTRDSMAGRAILERRVVQYEDVTSGSGAPPASQRLSKLLGFRAIISVPFLRNGVPAGALTMARQEPGLFSDRHVDLLRTFADQAVIAIENVRLFTELQHNNRALTETLEQQTATSEVLRAINRAHTDAQPVFDVIAASALRLCGAVFSAMVLYDGKILRLVAVQNAQPEGAEALRSAFPRPVDEGSATGRAILSRAVVSIPDVLEDPHFTYGSVARVANYRSVLAVPMIRDGEPIGVILVTRPEPGPFSDKEAELLKTFADQAVITIENVRLFNETKEALEQQTATAEILRVISTSPTDLQPVLDALARSAVRFCGAYDATLFQVDGETYRVVAHQGPIPFPLGARFPLVRGYVTGRSILDRQPVHVRDLQAETSDFPQGSALASKFGQRTTLAVPLLREGEAIGTVQLRRTEAKPFTDKEIALLKTFADQAVIAIENVRLFTELQASNHDLTQALEQQTATSEILKVISSSPTDEQPVFDAIAGSALRLCGAAHSVVGRYDGELLHLAAHAHVGAEGVDAMGQLFPMRPSRTITSTRAILDRTVVHLPDVLEDPDYDKPTALAMQNRATLAVPMLRDGEPIGTIFVGRPEPQPFTEKQIELLKTFAAQAVIAIENVRLFTELQQKNGALTHAHAQVIEALEQQTATSEILQVISSSPTDVQPVYDSIVERAARLCGAEVSLVARLEGEWIHVGAVYGTSVAGADAVRQTYPMRPGAAGATARAIRDSAIAHIPDVLTDQEFTIRDAALTAGFRAVLAVPMLREGRAIGAIAIGRAEAGEFSTEQVNLLHTFADQAIIAIENVRLFTELQTSNRELTSALDTQTATSDILRVISRSQTDVQPVFDAIVRSAVRLLGGHSGLLTRVVGDQCELGAFMSTDPAAAGVLSVTYPRPVNSPGAHGQAIRDRAPVNILDMHMDLRLTEAGREDARVGGYRSMVVVPLLRQDVAIGALAVTRREPGGFTDDEIALLQTFADQAVIAIENARLLTELRARTQELTRSVEQLTALGEVGRAVSSTLDLETVLTTIVSRAVQLSGLDGGVVFEYDEGAEEFVQRAMTQTGDALAAARRTTRVRKGEGVLGRTAITLEPVQVADIAVPGAYEGRLREILIDSGIRAILAVPMVREGRLIGCLGVTRNRPGDFPAETIELLRTFATQSALAIQNARLFHEIEDKSRQLEAASRHKSEFLANMSHELRTPLNAIIGFSEILAEKMFGDINEKQTEYLQDILESGRHLLSLINDILDLSKIEAGRMELELTDFNLPTAIENALILVRERASRRRIRLGSTIDPHLGMLSGDERKVKQVLLNLLSNALKFTPEGGRIDVGARLHDQVAEVSVTDTGVGIAPEDQEAVFEEFRQVGTADKKAEGTGLGLALSRKFIELHGGRIWVTSAVGTGSTFTFTIPVHRQPSDRRGADSTLNS